MANFIRNELVCVHPALDGSNRHLWQGMMYAEEQFSREYDLSYEMVLHLARLNSGTVDFKSDTAKRCKKIAVRKGCYKDPLMHEAGFLTDNAGQRALLDAKIIYGRIMAWHRVHGTNLPSVDETITMDEIIPWGNLSLYSLRMLQLAWELSPDERKPKKFVALEPVQFEWDLDVVEVDQEPYALLASIRDNIHTRRAVEALIKFGLVDLVTLPKAADKKGRGRGRAGFHISAAGIRFFSDYLDNFNEQAKFHKEASRPPDWWVKSHQESEMSDVVDGENLRELFG